MSTNTRIVLGALLLLLGIPALMYLTGIFAVLYIIPVLAGLLRERSLLGLGSLISNLIWLYTFGEFGLIISLFNTALFLFFILRKKETAPTLTSTQRTVFLVILVLLLAPLLLTIGLFAFVCLAPAIAGIIKNKPVLAFLGFYTCFLSIGFYGFLPFLPLLPCLVFLYFIFKKDTITD